VTPAKPVSAAEAHRLAAVDRQRGLADALLDAAAIRRLRLQAGYSTRRFARALGVSASTIRGLEDGSNHHQLPLTLIAHLAELLDVSTRELFACTGHDAVAPTKDDRTVEAALQSLPGVVAASDLAAALGWTLQRTRQALDALDQRLQSTGARLHRNGWQQYAIRPATEHLSDQQQQALHRIGHATVASTRSPHDCYWLPRAGSSTTAGSRARPTANAWPCKACSNKGPSSRSRARRRSSRPPTRSTASTPSCASRRASRHYAQGGYAQGPHACSTSYARFNAGRKTTRPTPTRRQPLKNSRHLTEETATSALNNS